MSILASLWRIDDRRKIERHGFLIIIPQGVELGRGLFGVDVNAFLGCAFEECGMYTARLGHW